MRISDWSSDVCASDLRRHPSRQTAWDVRGAGILNLPVGAASAASFLRCPSRLKSSRLKPLLQEPGTAARLACKGEPAFRSEEHTSELQSLMRISYAVFCLKKNIQTKHTEHTRNRIITSN